MTIPNVLAERYASTEMTAIFDRRERIVLERRFWVAVLEAQIDLGLDVVADKIRSYHGQIGGEHWELSPLISRLAEQGETFASLS